MATVKVKDLLNRAQVILQDTTSTRWPVDELLDWLSDSYREIILARPDANSATGEYTCDSGTRQKLTKASGGFPNALRLLDVVRNTAATSLGRAVRHIDRQILDDQRAGWHKEAQGVDIQHFMFDPRLPTEFLVYPPASSTAKLEVVFSSVPTAHALADATSASATIKLDDSYANAMLDYILYRAYTKDAEYAANAQRAAAHYQALTAALGIKTQADTGNDPKEPGFTTYAK